MTYSAWITGIWNLRQALQQAGDLLGLGIGELTELVKDRREQCC
ncbi:hypothetical protein ACQEV4_30840 [Streptomyces shenzhenensis]